MTTLHQEGEWLMGLSGRQTSGEPRGCPQHPQTSI